MFDIVSRLFRSSSRSRTLRRLSEERTSHFFSWFHLEPDGEPNVAGPNTRVSFRPSGAAFQALIRLDVSIQDSDQIAGSELWIDRRFVDGAQSPFARDIAAAFLSWALRDEVAETKNILIANVKDMNAGNAPVIMRQDAIPPKPSPDHTGGYAVFTGHREFATLAFSGSELTLRNNMSDDSSQRSLALQVTYKSA